MPRAVTIALAAAGLAACVGIDVSPYAGQQNRPVKALSANEIRDLSAGRGMGLAKAAELNGYPGPMHVLELADALALTPQQRSATQTLFESMRARAIELGRALIEEEAALDEAFSQRRIDADLLDQRMRRIAGLNAQLRAVHLKAHLDQTRILEPAQIERYAVMRGYR